MEGIYTASGKQLDDFGVTFGVPRDGLPDAEYRTLLIARAYPPEPGTMASLVAMAEDCGHDNCISVEIEYTVYLFVDGEPRVGLVEGVERCRPVGVEILVLNQTELEGVVRDLSGRSYAKGYAAGHEVGSRSWWRRLVDWWKSAPGGE